MYLNILYARDHIIIWLPKLGQSYGEYVRMRKIGGHSQPTVTQKAHLPLFQALLISTVGGVIIAAWVMFEPDKLALNDDM